MVEAIVYDVTPHGDGWMLGRRGNGEKSLNFATREQAIAEGERRAQRAGRATLVIRDEEGRIEEERSVGS